jgi:hypothetical protein
MNLGAYLPQHHTQEDHWICFTLQFLTAASLTLWSNVPVILKIRFCYSKLKKSWRSWKYTVRLWVHCLYTNV